MYNPNSIFVAQKWFEVQVDHRTTFDKVRKEIKKTPYHCVLDTYSHRINCKQSVIKYIE